jgi:hypothetical protein
MWIRGGALLFFLFVAQAGVALASHVELVLKRVTLSDGVVLEPGALIEILNWEELSSAQYRNFRVLSDASGKAPKDPRAVYRESAVSFEGTTSPIDLLRMVAKPKEQSGCSPQALETGARLYRQLYIDRYPKLVPAGHTAVASVVRLDIQHAGHSATLSNQWPHKPIHLNIDADPVNTERNLVLVRTSDSPPRAFISIGSRSYHIDFTGAEPLSPGQEIRYLLEHPQGKDAKLAPLTSRDATTPNESVGGVGALGYRGLPVVASHDAQWSVSATPDPSKKK